MKERIKKGAMFLIVGALMLSVAACGNSATKKGGTSTPKQHKNHHRSRQCI